MEYHYEYSTYNKNHKVLVDLQASNMDALKSKSCVQFGQICVFTLVARRCRKSSSFFCIHLIQVVTIIVQWKYYCSLWGCQFPYYYRQM